MNPVGTSTCDVGIGQSTELSNTSHESQNSSVTVYRDAVPANSGGDGNSSKGSEVFLLLKDSLGQVVRMQCPVVLDELNQSRAFSYSHVGPKSRPLYVGSALAGNAGSIRFNADKPNLYARAVSSGSISAASGPPISGRLFTSEVSPAILGTTISIAPGGALSIAPSDLRDSVSSSASDGFGRPRAPVAVIAPFHHIQPESGAELIRLSDGSLSVGQLLDSLSTGDGSMVISVSTTGIGNQGDTGRYQVRHIESGSSDATEGVSSRQDGAALHSQTDMRQKVFTPQQQYQSQQNTYQVNQDQPRMQTNPPQSHLQRMLSADVEIVDQQNQPQRVQNTQQSLQASHNQQVGMQNQSQYLQHSQQGIRYSQQSGNWRQELSSATLQTNNTASRSVSSQQLSHDTQQQSYQQNFQQKYQQQLQQQSEQSASSFQQGPATQQLLQTQSKHYQQHQQPHQQPFSPQQQQLSQQQQQQLSQQQLSQQQQFSQQQQQHINNQQQLSHQQQQLGQQQQQLSQQNLQLNHQQQLSQQQQQLTQQSQYQRSPMMNQSQGYYYSNTENTHNDAQSNNTSMGQWNTDSSASKPSAQQLPQSVVQHNSQNSFQLQQQQSREQNFSPYRSHAQHAQSQHEFNNFHSNPAYNERHQQIPEQNFQTEFSTQRHQLDSGASRMNQSQDQQSVGSTQSQEFMYVNVGEGNINRDRQGNGDQWQSDGAGGMSATGNNSLGNDENRARFDALNKNPGLQSNVQQVRDGSNNFSQYAQSNTQIATNVMNQHNIAEVPVRFLNQTPAVQYRPGNDPVRPGFQLNVGGITQARVDASVLQLNSVRIRHGMARIGADQFREMLSNGTIRLPPGFSQNFPSIPAVNRPELLQPGQMVPSLMAGQVVTGQLASGQLPSGQIRGQIPGHNTPGQIQILPAGKVLPGQLPQGQIIAGQTFQTYAAPNQMNRIPVINQGEAQNQVGQTFQTETLEPNLEISHTVEVVETTKGKKKTTASRKPRAKPKPNEVYILEPGEIPPNSQNKKGATKAAPRLTAPGNLNVARGMRPAIQLESPCGAVRLASSTPGSPPTRFVALGVSDSSGVTRAPGQVFRLEPGSPGDKQFLIRPAIQGQQPRQQSVRSTLQGQLGAQSRLRLPQGQQQFGPQRLMGPEQAKQQPVPQLMQLQGPQQRLQQLHQQYPQLQQPQAVQQLMQSQQLLAGQQQNLENSVRLNAEPECKSIMLPLNSEEDSNTSSATLSQPGSAAQSIPGSFSYEVGQEYYMANGVWVFDGKYFKLKSSIPSGMKPPPGAIRLPDVASVTNPALVRAPLNAAPVSLSIAFSDALVKASSSAIGGTLVGNSPFSCIKVSANLTTGLTTTATCGSVQPVSSAAVSSAPSIPIKPKRETEPGKFAVCKHCGATSANYDNCDSCRRLLPEDCKFVYLDHLKTVSVPVGKQNKPSPHPTWGAAGVKVESVFNPGVNSCLSLEKFVQQVAPKAAAGGDTSLCDPATNNMAATTGKKRGPATKRPAASRSKKNEVVHIVLSDDEEEISQENSNQGGAISNVTTTTTAASAEEPSIKKAKTEDVQLGISISGDNNESKPTIDIPQPTDQSTDTATTEKSVEIYLNVAKLFIGKIPAAQNCVVRIDTLHVYFEDERLKLKVADMQVIGLHLTSPAQAVDIVLLHVCPAQAQQMCSVLGQPKELFDPEGHDDIARFMVLVLTEPMHGVKNDFVTLVQTVQNQGSQLTLRSIDFCDANFMNRYNQQATVLKPINITPTLMVSSLGQTFVVTCASVPQGGASVVEEDGGGEEGGEGEDEDRSLSPTPKFTVFSSPNIRLFTYPPAPATGGIPVTNEDLFCLNDGEFLNDVIIDFYLKYVMREKFSDDCESTHIFSSFFYRRLTQKTAKKTEEATMTMAQRRHHRVRTWTRHVDIFSKKFIIVPINESSHWYLAIICFPGLAAESLASQLSYTSANPAASAAAPDTAAAAEADGLGNDSSATAAEPAAMETNSSCEGESTAEVAAENAEKADTAAAASEPVANTEDTEGSCVATEAANESDQTKGDSTAVTDESSAKNEVKEATTAPPTSRAGRKVKTTAVAAAAAATKSQATTKRGAPKAAAKSKCKKEPEPVKQRPCILVFDSLSGPGRCSVVKMLREYLQVEWDIKKKAVYGDCQFGRDSMTGLTPVCPQQSNFSDCGLYVLQYVESFFKDPIADYSFRTCSLASWFNDIQMRNKRSDLQHLILDLQKRYNPQLTYDPAADGCVIRKLELPTSQNS